jgi:hypothetical protein
VMLYAFDKVDQRTAAIIRGRCWPNSGRLKIPP